MFVARIKTLILQAREEGTRRVSTCAKERPSELSHLGEIEELSPKLESKPIDIQKIKFQAYCSSTTTVAHIKSTKFGELGHCMESPVVPQKHFPNAPISY